MNKKAAKFGLWFYLITMILAFIFPKIIFGNLFRASIYLVVSLTILYFINFWKEKMNNKNSK